MSKSLFLRGKALPLALVLLYVCVIGTVNLSAATPTTSTDVLYGDVSGDGVVDSADYTYMRRYLLEMIDSFPAANGKIAADVNLDNKIDSADYTYLRRFLLKIITSLPIRTTSITPTPTNVPENTPSPDPNPNKIVALSFDDGPDTQLTSLVLDKLDKHNVPASFFMIGQKINDSTSDVIKRIINSGCEIENHSWDHSDMSSMSVANIQKSIADTNEAIYKYSGTTPKFFRPPYISTSATLFGAVDLTFICGVGAYDWIPTNDAQTRANYIINGISDGGIILLHDVQGLPHPTPEALDIIIPKLKSLGYEFVTVSELFNRKGVTLSPTDSKIYTTVP